MTGPTNPRRNCTTSAMKCSVRGKVTPSRMGSTSLGWLAMTMAGPETGRLAGALRAEAPVGADRGDEQDARERVQPGVAGHAQERGEPPRAAEAPRCGREARGVVTPRTRGLAIRPLRAGRA